MLDFPNLTKRQILDKIGRVVCELKIPIQFGTKKNVDKQPAVAETSRPTRSSSDEEL